jgi:hypothetical protein
MLKLCFQSITTVLISIVCVSVFAQTAPATQTAAANEIRNAETWLRDGDRIFVQYGVFNTHFKKNPEHENENNKVTIQIYSNYDRVWGADKTIFGISLLKNSFGQPTQYLYWGQKWDFGDYFYAKITAGLIHGYKGQYRDKIPFNKAGVAPAIIPTFGVQYKDVSVEGMLLGASAFMVGVGYTF